MTHSHIIASGYNYNFGVVSYGGYSLELCVDVSSLCEAEREWCFSSSCEAGRVSVPVVLSGVSPALRSWTCLSSCRAETSCVEALEKPDKLHVDSQLVNSFDQFSAQLLRSSVGREHSC